MGQLNNLISKLSKASPESVHTLNTDTTSLFTYLHIETPVEKKYIETLISLKNDKSIIFLCGSSGDGKSAIIAKNKIKFENFYDYHVDATHSFKPDQTATEALDESFNSFDNNQKSLVVGINIGILMNYVDEGDESNIEIKNAINNYLKNKQNENNIYFINFEDYSKFEFVESKISSIFIQSLFQKITLQSEENPFYKAFLIDKDSEKTSILHQNFKLLSIDAIQNSIIELLITVNLKYDQFITTRSLLDFIYTLLQGPKLLINQLFEDSSNAIIKNIRKEDPVLIRSYQLDKFILERASLKEDEYLTQFINIFNEMCTKNILDENHSSLIIRTFYLFRNNDISNNYHKKFINNFDDITIYNFINLVATHQVFNDENKKVISIEKQYPHYVPSDNTKIPKLIIA
ncbi:MAG: DNA phosphorothioation-dependent restriction protein DptF [Campylobacterales bacterium]|nr:DNA phosphorothioation-dependent restriction protein DptF [Campylobacterales bacterium]